MAKMSGQRGGQAVSEYRKCERYQRHVAKLKEMAKNGGDEININPQNGRGGEGGVAGVSQFCVRW